MILTGAEIGRQVESGRIIISDFDGDRLEPNSYGFRLGCNLVEYTDQELDCGSRPSSKWRTIPQSGFVLRPGRLYLAETAERMGSEHYAAMLYACRSVSTLGSWIQFSAPLGHIGAIIPWTLEIMVAHPLRIYPYMPIGKISFWQTQGAVTGYAGRYATSQSLVVSRLAYDFVSNSVAS